MKSLIALVGTLAMTTSCSQGVSVDNGNPSGTVAGVIVDATNEQPLAGATVTVIAGDKTETAMADMNGQFAVTKVPAGTFIMSVAQMGYVTAQITDTLSGAVGNFPVSNPQKTVGPLGLIPAGGTFAVHVIDESGGAVASLKLSARTMVRQVIFQNGTPVGQGGYEVSATTGADGTATFSGLPMYGALAGIVDDTFQVAVPPTKVMGTEIYNFLGLLATFHLNGLGSSAQVIHLAGPNTPLVISDSNIEYLRGRTGSATPAFAAPVGSLVPINGPINIAFNQAINGSSLRAQFLDADGKPMSNMAMAMVTLNVVQITPSAPLPAGKRFNLILHATAATQAGTVGGPTAELNTTAPFFTQPPSGAPIAVVANSVATVAPAAGPVEVSFELSEPIGVGGGNNAVLDCVAFYEVPSSAGFNNDPNVPFQGDWKATPASSPPTNLVCRQPLGVVGGPQINVTQLTSLESTNATNNPTLVTGFSSKFKIQISLSPQNANAGPCKMQNPVGTLPGCSLPATGTKVHLVFSRQDSTTTVKRVNGTPVPDTIIVQL
ncbi:MAG: putative lipoprotein [Myxococcales bacterium]|nr:putative lipoprotein [Myxococcales bacterium]